MNPLIQVKQVRKIDATVIRQLADAFAAEWPEWAATLSREALEGTFASAERGALPVVLAATADGKAIGTIALRPWFGEEPMPETPWVRGFWVAQEYRGSGVARRLMEAIERVAHDLGYRTIYAGTTSIEKLLARRGWNVFRRIEHHGEPMAWLEKPLQ